MSARGLADLLETEQQPTQSGGGGGGGTVGGATGTIPAPTVALDATNLSWQDELKTVFPNVNISFGGDYTHSNQLYEGGWNTLSLFPKVHTHKQN